MAWLAKRAWYARLITVAVGVTALAGVTSVWVADAGPFAGAPHAPQRHSPLWPQRAPVSPEIAHASDHGAQGVNITIDDGPDPTWTPEVLQVLRENGVKATFCMLGPEAKAHPELVREVVADGHRLCDHTVSHDTTMDKKPESYQSQEILGGERMITEASGGVRPLYYRAPGGAFTPYSRRLAASRGMRPLGWNVDSKDFDRQGTDVIVSTVKSEISNGPTVLFHDAGGDRSQTVAALRQILPWLKQQGYSFGFPVR